MIKRRAYLFILLFAAFFKAEAQTADLRLLQSINGPAATADHAWANVSKVTGVVSMLAPVTMLTVGLANNDKELTVKAFETAGAVIIAKGLA
ncbi:hypothetical protein [Mucilaginibacter antarcticus]|uniref:Uncharacterized protein n=1 Tax=Mucilaginibacter antarcticus TaxID=1855725 RepID=A0ABW5XT69_9SPHI